MDYEKSDNVFIVKGKVYVATCKIYQGNYICKDDYIGEAGRNIVIRWGEHNNPTHDSNLVH